MKLKISKGKQCFIYHKWQLIHSTGITDYSECKDCKTRFANQLGHFHQPINLDWVNFKKSNEELINGH